MSDQPSELPESGFRDLVRDALIHLYDATHLRVHPLTRLLPSSPGENGIDRGKLLLQALLDAIEEHRPPPQTPADSHAWRTYHLLELRYIGGWSANEVLNHLGISKSQYQRDHASALDALATLLRNRWHVDLDKMVSCEGEASKTPDARQVLAIAEAKQLVTHMCQELMDIPNFLASLSPLLKSLCAQSNVVLSLNLERQLPTVRADRVALRQAFLGLINVACTTYPGAAVKISANQFGRWIRVTMDVSCARTTISSERSLEWTSPEIEVSRRLVEGMGGQIQIEDPGQINVCRASVRLPLAHRPTLLVVDNSSDFVDLVCRYLTETDWNVLGVQDVEQARNLIRDTRPGAILLDVMMPRQDGWDLLLDLKSHVESCQIPVIICSVLYEPQMARALGAVSYLAKPVSQAALLEVLIPFQEGMHELE